MPDTPATNLGICQEWEREMRSELWRNRLLMQQETLVELALRAGHVKSSKKNLQDEENHPDLGHCVCCHGGKLFCNCSLVHGGNNGWIGKVQARCR